MKIVAISDTHGKKIEIPECDLLLHCGDISPVYDYNLYFQKQWFFNDFLENIQNLPAKRIVFIAGNHDSFLYDCYKTKSERIIKDALPYNATYLRDNYCVVDGVKIYGYPWTPSFGWTKAFMDKEPVLHVISQNIPIGMEIVISHGPPFGACDMIPEIVCGRHGEAVLEELHLGSKALRIRIEEVQPEYMFCGHIHTGAHRFENIGRTMVRNVSIIDESYEKAYEPFYMEI